MNLQDYFYIDQSFPLIKSGSALIISLNLQYSFKKKLTLATVSNCYIIFLIFSQSSFSYGKFISSQLYSFMKGLIFVLLSGFF